MKTIIVYATKSGASRDCATILADKIQECETYDITKNSPSISQADVIILGSGVRMGHMYPPIRKFIKQNLEILLTKRIAIYLCNAYPDNTSKVIHKDIPLELAGRASYIDSVGGILPFTTPTNKDWLKKENILNLLCEVYEKEEASFSNSPLS